MQVQLRWAVMTRISFPRITHQKQGVRLKTFDKLCLQQFRKLKGDKTNEHQITTLEDYVIVSFKAWRRSSEELRLSVNKPVGFRLQATHRG